MAQDWLIPVAEARAAALAQAGQRYVEPLVRGTMSLGFYQPDRVDDQGIHSQDEIYIVAAGTATFLKAGERHPIGPLDALFVEAGVDHRFEDFSEDFAVWAIFYGPQGGEGD